MMKKGANMDPKFVEIHWTSDQNEIEQGAIIDPEIRVPALQVRNSAPGRTPNGGDIGRGL